MLIEGVEEVREEVKKYLTGLSFEGYYDEDDGQTTVQPENMVRLYLFLSSPI